MNKTIYGTNTIREKIFEYFKNEPTDVLATAYMYAKNMNNYGVDITKALDTAIHQQAVIHQAYLKGMADEKMRYDLDKLKCGREYVEEFYECPMCTDCPDNCPLDKRGE